MDLAPLLVEPIELTLLVFDQSFLLALLEVWVLGAMRRACSGPMAVHIFWSGSARRSQPLRTLDLAVLKGVAQPIQRIADNESSACGRENARDE